jgi:adenylylsulfate kinase-like enzyme/phospholipid N-methyltransferase
MHEAGVLYWITGLSGAGKTTVGNRLFYELREKYDNVVLLDGDILKNIVNEKVEYDEDSRRKRAMQYAKICQMLTNQDMIVICCTIAMYDEVREWNRNNNKRYVEVFLDVPFEILRQRDQKGLYSAYENGKIKNLVRNDNTELPKNPDIVICNDGKESLHDIVNKILEKTPVLKSDYDRDTSYWNKYYENRKATTEPSKFAAWVSERLTENRNILELGCGNGRDSLYFRKKGMNVTAVDASRKVIEQLKKENQEDNIYFVCDDFVCTPTIFSGQFDYVYSRFSLHAINEKQETEVIKNVFRVLKNGGRFFIETRGIHDELYGKGEKLAENTYFYEGHFRRFIEREKLVNKLKKEGFAIEYEAEERGFAPYGDADPLVIRIVAEKQNEQ